MKDCVWQNSLCPVVCEIDSYFLIALKASTRHHSAILITTGAASALNAFLMRKHELKEGIEVLDSEGKVVGTSQVAAKNVSHTENLGSIVHTNFLGSA